MRLYQLKPKDIFTIAKNVPIPEKLQLHEITDEERELFHIITPNGYITYVVD